MNKITRLIILVARIGVPVESNVNQEQTITQHRDNNKIEEIKYIKKSKKILYISMSPIIGLIEFGIYFSFTMINNSLKKYYIKSYLPDLLNKLELNYKNEITLPYRNTYIENTKIISNKINALKDVHFHSFKECRHIMLIILSLIILDEIVKIFIKFYGIAAFFYKDFNIKNIIPFILMNIFCSPMLYFCFYVIIFDIRTYTKYPILKYRLLFEIQEFAITTAIYLIFTTTSSLFIWKMNLKYKFFYPKKTQNTISL